MTRELIVKIYETDDYETFKRLVGNRDVKCVKKIIDSIGKHGYIPNPIMVNENMEIIDGQNRAEALKQLGLPILYYIVEGADIEIARALNLGRTNWKPIDYVKSYAEDGYKSYLFLLRLVKRHKSFSLQEIYGVATGDIMTNGWSTKSVVNGTFELSDSEFVKAEELIGYLEQINNEIKAVKGSRRALTTGLAWCMRVDGCDIRRLLNVFQRKYPLIRPVVDTEYLLYDITKIYNDSLKIQSKRIDFDVIYRNSKR